MKIKKYLSTFLLTFLVNIAIYAEQNPALDTFAYEIPIINTVPNTLNTFIIPQAVYQNNVYADLSDVRLFDADKQIVPMQIQDYANETSLKTEVLKFYPVNLAQKQQAGNSIVQFIKQDDGTITQVNVLKQKNAERNAAYIIDASQMQKKQTIDKLQFNWQTQTSKTWVSKITIEGSNDLSTWQPLQQGVLAQLSSPGNLIQHNTIVLPNSHYNYLLVQIDQPVAQMRITHVTADLSKAHPAAMQWITVTPDKIIKSDATYIFYKKSNYPAQQMRFDVPGKNFSAEATIYARDNNQQSWNYIKSSLIYRLDTDNHQFQQLSTSLPDSKEHYWKIHFKPFLGEQLKIQFGWPAAQIYFLTNDKSAYQLAFGNAAIDQRDAAAAASIQQWIKDNKQVKPHTITVNESMKTLAGETALSKQYALPYQKLLLWIILVAAVILLGLMAMHLYRKTEEK